MTAQPKVLLSGVSKSFGSFQAVADLKLSVAAGEFLTLLGPSGCGKTTTLNMIAGFEFPDAGEIWLDDRNVTRTPPFLRNVNTVFQSYALFPHMTVAQNVAFGLRVQKTPAAEVKQRVKEALALVQMESFADRYPKQLSGGQQQRVALARAIVLRPQVLLLDEPLGALDLKLRKEMQVELKHLQQKLGITFLFVTHDQEEALTMSDRIVVMNRGKIEQIGTPGEVYERPRTRFVAEFIGETNILPSDLLHRGSAPGGLISLRPERIEAARDGAPYVTATVTDRIYVGEKVRLLTRLPNGASLAVSTVPTGPLASVQAGESVRLTWAPEAQVALAGTEAVHEEAVAG
jgi:ABC-type Fe3+/spermidine/putrescine transport system ATPase subunit